MAQVRSAWTSIPIPPDGMLPAAEWAGAGVMQIPAGFLMVKNDADSIYVALDVVGDTVDDIKPGVTGDYFWFVIDIDNNGAVTPNRDLLYSVWPGQANRLGRWIVSGPNQTWPASTNQVLSSTLHAGFGPSLNSPNNHRMWEIRFKLNELGITLDPFGQPPILRFGLRLVSRNPLFTFDFPANPMSAFNNFHQIILATGPQAADSYPKGTAGIVIGGVGLIPATKIGDDGYANIAITEPYRIHPDEAAFGGTMDLIGNTVTLPKLWTAGARKYRVFHRFGNTATVVNAATWTPIRQNWGNYLWTGNTYVWESFGPDAMDMYPLVDPSLDYSIKALLFEWDSSLEPNNLHQFKLEFYNSQGQQVTSPKQIITLRLDNRPPEVKLLRILHNQKEVLPCAIENIAGPQDGVQLDFAVFDAEGALLNYSLTAEFGAGNPPATIEYDEYSKHRNANHIWLGIPMPGEPPHISLKFTPPYSCAYLFRISAYDRTTDGNSYPLRWVTDFRTATLVRSDIALPAKPQISVTKISPLGYNAQKKTIEAGIEPKKLGQETIVK